MPLLFARFVRAERRHRKACFWNPPGRGTRAGASPAWPECSALGGGPARAVSGGGWCRGRQQRSLAGLVQVAERFAALGDTEVVERVLEMADTLAPTVTAGDDTGAALETLRVRGVPRLSQEPGRGAWP